LITIHPLENDSEGDLEGDFEGDFESDKNKILIIKKEKRTFLYENEGAYKHHN
jgi:hypothetical protein